MRGWVDWASWRLLLLVITNIQQGHLLVITCHQQQRPPCPVELPGCQLSYTPLLSEHAMAVNEQLSCL